MSARCQPSAPARLMLAALTLSLVTGCSLVGEETAPEPSGSGEQAPTRVVLVAHDSWALPKRLVRDFETESGYQLVVRSSGDAGALTNKLVLTQGAPIGDVAFGVDNTFASRALDAGVFDRAEVTLPSGADRFALTDGADRLVPVDNGNVCVNIDTGWFAEHGLRRPRGLADLADPAYRGLFVTPAASTSSPGMAFLLATVAAYGDGWVDYWTRLMANDVAVTAGWSDAYFVDFTQGGGEGDRPIVVSYDSSPAFTLGKDGRSTTKALLDTCFQQVEYAGVLAGAANPGGARAVLDFLLSPEVQAALPESMYVFPVRDGVPLPADWARYAKRPTAPATLDPAEIAAHRDEWLTTWADVTSR